MRGWYMFSIFSVLPGAVSSCGHLRGEFRTVAPGTYVLSHVAGVSVPVVAQVRPDGVTMIVADTLWLREEGNGEEVLVVKDSVPGAAARPLRRERRELRYRRADTRIDVEFPCAPENGAVRACDAPPRYIGASTGTGFRIEMPLSYMTPFSVVPRRQLSPADTVLSR